MRNMYCRFGSGVFAESVFIQIIYVVFFPFILVLSDQLWMKTVPGDICGTTPSNSLKI